MKQWPRKASTGGPAPPNPGTARTTSRARTHRPQGHSGPPAGLAPRPQRQSGPPAGLAPRDPRDSQNHQQGQHPDPRDSQDHQQGQHPGAPEIGPPAGPAPTLQGQSGPPAGPAPPETLGTVRNTGSCWTPLPQGTVTSNRGICGSQWEVTFNAYIWNPEKLVLMNVFARKEWRHRCREWTVDAAGEGPRATEGEGGIDICTPSESGGQLRKPPCSPGSLV